MIASVTHIGPRADQGRRRKTAGQLAYEAAGDWVIEHDPPPKPLPTWDLLDTRAREYWDRIGASVRAPLIAAIWAFVDCEKSRPTREALGAMLAAAGLPLVRPIRGLWATP